MNVLLTLITPVFVYVANQASGKVTVIDAGRDSVVAVIDFTTLGFSAHPKPHHIVVEPDGSYWYVSLVGDNVVVKLDRANRIVAKAETVTPGLLALDPKSAQTLNNIAYSLILRGDAKHAIPLLDMAKGD